MILLNQFTSYTKLFNWESFVVNWNYISFVCVRTFVSCLGP